MPRSQNESMAALDETDPERRPLLQPMGHRPRQEQEDESSSDAESSCCGGFVGVWRILFSRDTMPRSAPANAEPTEHSAIAEDVSTAAESSPRARSPITAVSPCPATEPANDEVQAIIETPSEQGLPEESSAGPVNDKAQASKEPPPPADNGEGSSNSAPKSDLTSEQREDFLQRFRAHGEERRAKDQHKMGSQVIILSDLMSGDSRLVGLYASYFNFPILYLRSIKNASKRDFTHEYLKDLGVTVFQYHVDDAQKVYHDIDTKGMPALKAVSVTEKVSQILANESNNPFISKDGFLKHVRSKLHREDTPAGLEGLLDEQRPVLVLWTKGKVTDLYNGKPEHLLGNTGTQQILELARENGFATAIAGDLKLKPTHQNLVDHDLRFIEDGKLKGLSLKDQYAVLHRISTSTPLIHLGMRSGQLEPLPLLCMHTIYMEEISNAQAARMQKLANVTDLYERHQFAIPPTRKGLFRQAFTYQWEASKYKTEREKATPEGAKAVEAMHDAVKQMRLDAGEKMFNVGPDNAAEVFQDFKGGPAASAFQKGFLPEDREKIDQLLKTVKLKIALPKAARDLQALKAALPSAYPPSP